MLNRQKFADLICTRTKRFLYGRVQYINMYECVYVDPKHLNILL